MKNQFYTFRQEQWIERPIAEVFAFFAEAKNLARMTPPWIDFKILSMNSECIAEGTLIRYRLRLHSIPVYWKTEIRKWNSPYLFVDVQLAGPFKLWHHTHRFEDHGSRTKMVDVVRYSLPFGILGRLVHRLKVHGDVQRIFDYRRQRTNELL